MSHLHRAVTQKPNLENRYVFVCSGTNTSDQTKVCSGGDSRLNANGLTEAGKAEVLEAARQLVAVYKAAASDLILVGSDYLDAVETVKVLEAELGTSVASKQTALLRERSYGEFENESLESLVPRLFAKDEKDASSKTGGAESLIEVMTRTGKIVAQLEHEHKNAVVVIVAHAGVLQILQTAFIGTQPHHFRQISALAPGEIREMPHSAAQATLPRNPRQYRPSVATNMFAAPK